jgi:phospholipid N-methyltransferase
LKKRYGQHFISDRDLLQRIIELAHISSTDTVIEIGPGSGSLTRELAAVARRVVAIEIDRDLIGALRRTMPFNVEIVDADALGVDFEQYTAPYHVIGNLPYNVATVLLRTFISHRSRISEVTVMLQKEVAQRVCARPGTRDYGPLSFSSSTMPSRPGGSQFLPAHSRRRPKSIPPSSAWIGSPMSRTSPPSPTSFTTLSPCAARSSSTISAPFFRAERRTT